MNIESARLTIRAAAPRDVDRICAFGARSDVFRINNYLRFYERSEVLEWVLDNQNNVVLVAEYGTSLVGFLVCKIMSHHWALLDNFYVDPDAPCTNGGRELLETLEDLLRSRKLTYISTLVRSEKPSLIRLCRSRGFQDQGSYVWMDKLL